jgi:ADP-ribose pyrophosphatase
MNYLKKWHKTSTKILFDSSVIKLEVNQAINPRNGKIGDYYKAKYPDWANVIALTPQNEIILIKQYRHGSESIEIEIPGGCIERGENPLEAASRELLEETGYSGSSPILLGSMKPNPSIQDNSCYSILIKDCQKNQAQELDNGEDIEVLIVPLADIPQMIAIGDIDNAMIISAFYYLQQYNIRLDVIQEK